MAPPKKRTAPKDDDFVLTLSDDENDVFSGINEDGDDHLDEETAKSTTKKRKRDTAETTQSKNKKQKQQKQSKNGKRQKKVEEAASEPEEGSEEEEDAGEDDGALNSDFEFDVGAAAQKDVVEGFDGWGLDDTKDGAKKNGDKQGVDIDEIISRRQAKKEAQLKKKPKKQEVESEEEGSGNEDASDGGMSVDFQDDELMAEDGFGMGADGEDESGQSDAQESGSEDEHAGSDAEDSDDDDDDAASDNDSVATPVQHPDDVASDNDGSDIESDVDAEEEAKRKAFFAPEEQTSEQSAAELSKKSFQEFNLSRPILRGLAAVNFTNPTPIQRKTIPVALLGKDIVGSAVTGSGKTAAFVVPILERLLFRPRKVPTSRVAILMPTRELAVQCYNVATKLATYTDITFCQLVGGFSLREQENILKKRPDVIIATPGRFIDHMRNSASFTVDTLEILVLDEADRMLEDGFADELNEILTTIPKSRQTMLFSATMTDSVDKLIRVGLNRPVRLMVDSKKNTSMNLVQEFVRLRPGREDKRLGYLLHLCKEVYTGRVIVFFRQKKEAHRVRIAFGLLGLKAAELHGSMSQEQRIRSVENFREGKVSFLLATDLAARGLDIKGVETVINYEAPQSHEIYLHRVGRTARAGRSGRACTIAAEPDRKVVKAAVKASKAQGAKVASRVVDPAVADRWAEKAKDLEEEINAVLEEEKIEKQLAQAEMQVTRSENMIKHEAEIMSRPKRTWFASEREKILSKKAGAAELNGLDSVKSKKEKVRLSNKDKKRLDDSRQHPSKKYKRFKPLHLPDRQWPNKVIEKAPRWLATDLRDGNQSLPDPMDGEQKFRFFKMLVDIGYKEIEVSFPSASQTDFDFTRRLVETPGVVPDDVWLQVLSPCREDLIRRTVDSLKGAKKAILHIYLATSPCFRRIVFNMDKQKSLEMAVRCTKFARSITKDDPSTAGTEWHFEFSPETFSDTEPEFAAQVCQAVKEAWGPTEEAPIIFNLPATVEMSTPNVFADQIEYFCRHVSEREKYVVSIHPHNDRGCAIAAAELAQMAGAQRVEGTLFGNGERTGNVDLVTLALNLYTQGITPNVDFSDINAVIKVVEESNKIPVNERWPYGGQLVVCAFSGSHQDAIKKGFKLRDDATAASDEEVQWEIPYLPLDPQDIGRTYEAVIRVNSQSGKGGAAWVILRSLELDLPRALQVEFSKIVQKKSEEVSRELRASEIVGLFEEAYHLKSNPRFNLVDYNITTDRSTSPAPPEPGKALNTKNLKRRFTGVIEIDGVQHAITGVGPGAISSLAGALSTLGIDLDVVDYKEHSIGLGREVKAATYIQCTAAGSKEQVWGVGIHQDVVQASLIALLSAASSFLTSRAGSPAPFRPIRSNTLTDEDLQALETLTGSSDLATDLAKAANGSSKSQVDIDALTRQAESQ
ncbi:2-isopropylmalate synthase [Aspergillus minisclerotigenes]|uniref:2-isopropylmalate synthase n=1 Tax=Aspergillus minisclerotigenes TaxID=656917 RepID=A0A5N6J646_9EURO|nr:2-isopropylmalate synthase [Aspergillus minisclerotigenes]